MSIPRLTSRAATAPCSACSATLQPRISPTTDSWHNSTAARRLGIVTCEFDQSRQRHRFHVHKDFGLVNDVYSDGRVLTDMLRGHSAIGHNRYSTAGSANNRANVQPFTVLYKSGNLAIGHNGNLTNFREIRQRLQDSGTIFQTTSDTEVILHLIARSPKKDQLDQIRDAIAQVKGAFSS